MGGQLDGNFLAGSLPHKFIILIFTSFICLWSINFSVSLWTVKWTSKIVEREREPANQALLGSGQQHWVNCGCSGWRLVADITRSYSTDDYWTSRVRGQL